MQSGWQRYHNNNSNWWNGGGMYNSNSSSSNGYWLFFRDRIWRPLMNSPSRNSALVLFSFTLLVGAFLTTRLFDSTPSMSNKSGPGTVITEKDAQIPKKPRIKLEFPLNCSLGNLTLSCPQDYYPSNFHPGVELDQDDQDRPSCPDYFRWIHEDLRPWKLTGITKEMVESARKTANFKLVIVNGRAYVERYAKAYQTRDDFTLWGILQLLRRYPGKLPDLELMFDCVDWPVILSSLYKGPNATNPPPLFRYCGDHNTLDIVFPDWSFWGWAEVNIKPWDALLKELKEGNERTTWMKREPYAYWKGNPYVAPHREELLKCNVSEKEEWNARVYIQDWIKESTEGYKKSNLANQCTHRYKIYIEGSAWSVSEKYILACDSVTFIIKPKYYDFFTRGLMPVHHYWPIQMDDKCRSIKFAVDWGNSHKKKAQAIGRAASDFIQEDLKMDFVYDYMFHLLNEYAKLFKYKPTIPPNATELCSETMACPAEGLAKKFMLESLMKGPVDASPCRLPPPFDARSLYSQMRRKANSINQVELWESKYWENITGQKTQ